MPWTTPANWSSIPVPGVSDMNTQVRDNLNFLLNGKALAGSSFLNQVWSLTSTTTLTQIDGTNLTTTVNVTTGRLIVELDTQIQTSNNGSGGTLFLYLDGAAATGQGMDTTHGIADLPVNTQLQFARQFILTGLSAASHTVSLYWKVGAAGETIYLGNWSSPIGGLYLPTVWRVYEP